APGTFRPVVKDSLQVRKTIGKTRSRAFGTPIAFSAPQREDAMSLSPQTPPHWLRKMRSLAASPASPATGTRTDSRPIDGLRQLAASRMDRHPRFWIDRRLPGASVRQHGG